MIDCELYEIPGSTPNLAKFGGNVEFLSQVLWHGYTLFRKYYESAPKHIIERLGYFANHSNPF